MKPDTNPAPTPGASQAGQPPAFPLAAGSALRWRAHPTEPNVLQGYRPSQPETTLFRIELHPTKPHRGWLFGAFIPDSHERTDWTFGLVVALKVNAESYMREWVDEYNKQNTRDEARGRTP